MLSLDELHLTACKEGRDTYIDPASGHHVLTSQALLKQKNVVVIHVDTVLMDDLMCEVLIVLKYQWQNQS
jgi:hypothetical protein